MVRDAPYAKRAKVIVVNNVIGAGIGMQAQVVNQRGTLIDKINTDIEKAWEEWSYAENCHTGGKLCFEDFERQAMGQIFEAGEVLIRKHYQPFGNSKIPFALELVEAERLADEFTVPLIIPDAQMYRMGIERDEFGRPQAFWLRRYHPGEIRFVTPGQPDQLFRVPADQIWHLYSCDRWPQTRGEPWLHAAARRLNDMDGYSEAEIVAARGAASYMGIITSPEVGDPSVSTADGQSQFDLEPGLVQRLADGEKFDFVAPNRPNPNMDPFMRMMLREVAAGTGPSYESLSRDYSQSNFSSSRMGLLDDRDLWKTFQQWFIRSFREPLHKEWMQQAVLAKAIPSVPVEQYVADRDKFNAVSFKPRGWSWVDPVKEVDAYIRAVRAGFMTVSDVIALTGGGQDVEDMISKRVAELAMFADKDLHFDTDPVAVPASELGGKVADFVPKNEPVSTTDPKGADVAQPEDASQGRMTQLIDAQRDLASAIASMPAPVVNIAPQPVHVNTPAVNVAPTISLALPEGEKTFDIVDRDERGMAKTIRQRIKQQEAA